MEGRLEALDWKLLVQINAQVEPEGPDKRHLSMGWKLLSNRFLVPLGQNVLHENYSLHVVIVLQVLLEISAQDQVELAAHAPLEA